MGTPSIAGIKSTPYQHQWDCFNLSKDKEAFAIFSDLGTGKGLMVLMTAAYLYNAGKIKRLLVVAPKGCYCVWSEDEVPKHFGEALPYKIAKWSSYATKEDKTQLAQLEKPGEALRILVMNVEACTAERAVDFMIDFMKKEPTMLVVDESTVLKNPQAKRTKIMINVGKFAKYRRICSGSPMPNGPLDLFSQTEFLKKNLLGYSNYFAFRNRFAVLVDQQLGRQSFKKVVGYRDLDSLKMLMRRFSFIIKKADCLDLPHKVYQTVDIAMGPRQTAAYNKMLQDAFIQLSGASQVSATMIITQLLRLHQISCGFLKPDQMEEVPFGEENDRLETLLDLLEQAPGKVIIWATYRYNIREIIAAIGKKFGEKSVVDFYGATSADDRKEAKAAFQDPNSPVKYMVSNPASGRFGNTWTQGTTVIYYSNDYNLESREQSEDRAHRIGQLGAIHGDETEPSVLYIDLRAKGTVDEKIIKVLRAKKKLTDEVVASNWQWLMGSSVA
jgi:SNF2 family DNA or RNA helicase